jgi:two-component system, NtrC family, sensor kinase
MAAGTAHHLNTPLASMLLRVQMMRDRVEAQNGLGEDLEHIEHTIGFCQQFVRRLLDFSRRPSAVPEPQRIGPLLNSAISFVSPSLQAKRVKLTSRTAGLDESKVLADPNNLETLLLILLSNALDAVSEDGNINVTLTSLHSGKIDIIIADDGMGISEEDQKRLFEPFFTTKPIGKGTGLGLAIAKNIASEYGGEICLDSAPGLGTKAVVVLPIYSMPVSATQAQVVTQ